MILLLARVWTIDCDELVLTRAQRLVLAFLLVVLLNLLLSAERGNVAQGRDLSRPLAQQDVATACHNE